MSERTRERAIGLVIEEAALLDAARWQEWLALYAPDALYWIPLSPTHTDPALEQSLACEDRLLLAIRVERMSHPRAWSLYPPPGALHVLQTPIYQGFDESNGLHTVQTVFSYTETRAERDLRLGGRIEHRLRIEPGQALIVRKRIDLVHADAMLPAIYLPL